jgi:hypothetical protein
MIDRPLLLFPNPEIAKRSNLKGGSGFLHKPSPSRQNERLSPQFCQLQEVFSAKRVAIQQTTAGIDPEMVLVIETVGPIDNFVKTIKRINGLEWLAEIEEDLILPDKDFYDLKKPERKLSGRLFLVMTNHQALDQMVSLWNRYKKDPEMKFERGQTKFRDLFQCLKEIRYWNVQDRISETGILKTWQEDLQYEGNRMIRFQTELWYRSNAEKRQYSEEVVTDLIQQLGGTIINRCDIQEIYYHSLLAELPANCIQEIIDNPNTKLVECSGIMFFRPVGQMSVGKGAKEVELFDFTEDYGALPIPTGAPVVALLDGLPLANHQLLLDRLIIDDPDDWASAYTATERYHGTAMASLISYGDLNGGLQPLNHSIYVRPIMRLDPLDSFPIEYILEKNELAIDLIHRAVRRIVDHDGEEDAVAPTVKIINLSIGDQSCPFNQTMSPFARLLDWLSIRYNILFLVSAGNQLEPIKTGLKIADFNNLVPTELEDTIIHALYTDLRNRRIFSPAESINALTIGALHFDDAHISPDDRRINPFTNILPSPYSAFGSGYRRAVKPDLVCPGGRQLYETPVIGEPISLECSSSVGAPGIKVACPGNFAGDLNKTTFACGTSESTAIISHAATICYDLLIEIFKEQGLEIDCQPYIVPLLKAMIVHGCSWEGAGSHKIESVMRSEWGTRQAKNKICQWLGYGSPDISRVMGCNEQRVTLLGFGQLRDGEAHVFHLPIPPSLGGCREKRKLTVTLAYLSPIAANTQKYRVASLWYEIENELLGISRIGADHKTVRRGTVQHEIFVGERACPITDGDMLHIKVNCRNDAGKIKTPIKYGLIVSLEVAEGVDIAVYDEIRTRIAPTVMIRPEERIQL